MNILNRLIRNRKPVETIIWGIRVPEKVKERWSMLASIMRVPTNRMIMYVLNDRVQQNADTLKDREARNQIADRVSECYLKNSLS